jgi:hypothetical protein
MIRRSSTAYGEVYARDGLFLNRDQRLVDGTLGSVS